MLQIKKIESKKLKTFQKLLEWISSSTIRAGRARAEEEMFTWKLTKNVWKYQGISGNTCTITK